MFPRRHFPWVGLYVVLVLLCAQVFLASHEIEHLDQDHGEFCELCLVGANYDGSLPPSQPVPGTSVPLEYRELTAYRGPDLPNVRFLSYPQRAPPASDRILSRSA